MNILLVYPEFVETFWSLKGVFRFIGKTAGFNPLGLQTIAAMLPKAWEKRLVDTNVQKLKDEDIRWADYVFISAMITQCDFAKSIIARCKNLKKRVVLGGQILEMGYDEFPHVSHFFEGEVEATLPEFLRDLEVGCTRRVYSAVGFPDIALSPIPMWSLIDPRRYACILVQFCRGCPFNCEFCNIEAINGRKPRCKSPQRFLEELDAIYLTGFRGRIMLADDNFIGNRKRVKEMLRLLVGWQQERKYPISLAAEVDITLADDDELLELMVAAGFNSLFLGIETPNEESLIECGKLQNVGRDLIACVKKIHSYGILTMSGFILGFDHDGPGIFDQHLRFYQESGIVFPMIGVLQVPLRTKLFDRMKAEGRFLEVSLGSNTGALPNFIPKMPVTALMQGYRRVVETAYSPRNYYERIRVFLESYNPAKRPARKALSTDLRAFAMSLVVIGMFGGLKSGYYYWKTLMLALFQHPKAFPMAAALQISGWHFQRISKHIEK